MNSVGQEILSPASGSQIYKSWIVLGNQCGAGTSRHYGNPVVWLGTSVSVLGLDVPATVRFRPYRGPVPKEGTTLAMGPVSVTDFQMFPMSHMYQVPPTHATDASLLNVGPGYRLVTGW